MNHTNSLNSTDFNSADNNNIITDKCSTAAKHIAGKLYIYNCHFEIFCGMLSRVRQLG